MSAYVLPSGFPLDYVRALSDTRLLRRVAIEAEVLAHEAVELSTAVENAEDRATTTVPPHPARDEHLRESLPLAIISLSVLVEELCHRNVLDSNGCSVRASGAEDIIRSSRRDHQCLDRESE